MCQLLCVLHDNQEYDKGQESNGSLLQEGRGEESVPEVCQDECLHELREQHHGWPQPRADRLQEEGVSIDDLQGSHTL